MKCFNCDKPLGKKYIKSEPNRHLLSPNSINRGENSSNKYYNYYCNQICLDETNKKCYSFWAKLDRNASDSECFVHAYWEKDSLRRNIRVGKCKITEVKVRVEPLQPGLNSGQPKECYEHFILRKQYVTD